MAAGSYGRLFGFHPLTRVNVVVRHCTLFVNINREYISRKHESNFVLFILHRSRKNMHISLSSANYGLQILTFVCSSIAMTLGNQPTNLAMLQSASAPVYDNPTRVDIVVFPTKSWDPKAIEMIDQTIRKTVTIGHYQKHQGLYLPQFSNVLSWTIYSASTGEHQELVKQLSDIVSTA